MPQPDELPPSDPWADQSPWPTHDLPPAAPPPSAHPAPTLPYPVQVPRTRPPLPAAPPGQAPREGPGEAPVRAPRRSRFLTRATTPPPGWWPPYGYPVIVVRPRRRWPWVLLTLAVLIGCCCGVPLHLAKPMLDQYPATAALPREAAGLRLRDDAGSKRAARHLESAMRSAHLLAEDTFAGIYTTPDDKLVTVFGITGFRWDTGTDLKAEVTRLTPVYRLTSLRPISTGVRDEHVTCGTGRADGAAVVACTWADHGSLGTALFTRLSLDDSARLLARLRPAIISRG